MISKRAGLALSTLVFVAAPALAQAPRVHALVGARVVVAPGRTLPRATVVLRDGVIVAVGTKIDVPPEARVWDLTGKTIYPGLIDLWVPAGGVHAPAQPGPARRGRGGDDTETEPNVQAARDVLDQGLDAERTKAMRRAGFTTALVVPSGGIFRGRGAVVDLGDDPKAAVVRPDAVQAVSVKSQGFGRGYPSSLMGAVALVRQTLLDARWQRDALAAYAADPAQARPPYDRELAALEPALEGKQPVVFETDDVLAELRDAKIAEELGLRAWLVGNGREYERLTELAAHRLPLVLPLDFPDRPKLADEGDDLSVSLEDLRAWDLAPSNPARLDEAKLPFAITAFRQKAPLDLWKRLKAAIDRGFPAERALAALTVVPAELLGLSGRAGTIESGKLANLVVVDGDLLVEVPRVETVWVDGDPYPVEPDGAAGGRKMEGQR